MGELSAQGIAAELMFGETRMAWTVISRHRHALHTVTFLCFFSSFLSLKRTTGSVFKMPPCKLFLALTRAFRCINTCRLLQASKGTPLLPSAAVLCPLQIMEEEAWQECLHGSWESREQRSSSRMVGWRAMTSCWAAAAPPGRPSVCICPCLV